MGNWSPTRQKCHENYGELYLLQEARRITGVDFFFFFFAYFVALAILRSDAMMMLLL